MTARAQLPTVLCVCSAGAGSMGRTELPEGHRGARPEAWFPLHRLTLSESVSSDVKRA